MSKKDASSQPGVSSHPPDSMTISLRKGQDSGPATNREDAASRNGKPGKDIPATTNFRAHQHRQPQSQPLRETTTATTTTTTDLEAGPEDQQQAEPLRRVETQSAPFSAFTQRQKTCIVIAAAAGAVFSPLTAQIYLPALPAIARDFDVSISQVNLTVTTYMIFQGLTPMFIGAFADASGRRPAYLICFSVYMAANIGCALSPTYTSLLVLRMLQSAGSSTTVALSQAVVADIITSAERGQYVSYMSLPIMLAPALGPVIGGALAQYLGWRWTFWMLTIMCGAVAVMYLLFMPETCRGIVGDGSVVPEYWVHRSLWQVGKGVLETRQADRKAQQKKQHPQHKDEETEASSASEPEATSPAPAPATCQVTRRKFNVFRAVLILAQPDMFILLTYSSLAMANFYCLMTAIPAQFGSAYHLNDLHTGLIYLPLGFGTLIGAQVTGRLLDWNFRRHCTILKVPYERKKQLDLTKFPLELARLQIGIPALGLAACTVLAWGWVIQSRTHIAVPCVILFIAGFSLVGFTNTVNVLIVDVNPTDAGAATASNNLTRCLVGAAASAAIQPMINGVGDGWAFTILAAFVIIFGPPALGVLLWKGMGWRAARKERRERRRKELGEAAAAAEAGRKS